MPANATGSNNLFASALQQMKEEIVAELESKLRQEIQAQVRQEMFSRNLSLSEAAEYLRVSQQTVRRLIAGRQLRAFKIRQQIFIRLEDINDYIEAQLGQAL